MWHQSRWQFFSSIYKWLDYFRNTETFAVLFYTICIRRSLSLDIDIFLEQISILQRVFNSEKVKKLQLTLCSLFKLILIVIGVKYIQLILSLQWLAQLTSLFTAEIGPSPIHIGSKPTSATPIILASGCNPFDFTSESLANTTAAAPSFIPRGKHFY